jgi:hypothetical protein
MRFPAGADTRFSVCVSKDLNPDNLKVQAPSASQTAPAADRRMEGIAMRLAIPAAALDAFYLLINQLKFEISLR